MDCGPDQSIETCKPKTGEGTNSARPAGTPGLGEYAATWVLPCAEVRYARSREQGRFRHYDLEQALVGRWLRLCEPGALVLDLPCGTGRFTELVQQCGHRLISADLSYRMVHFAKLQAPPRARAVCCNLAEPCFSDGSVDIVLIWRLFHHFRTVQDRRTALEQARRLAKRYVIISYYNRHCATYWVRRSVRKTLGRTPKCRGAIWTSELKTLAEQADLSPVEIYHYWPGISINSAACFTVQGRTTGPHE